ncbi:LysR family transcriptional regulator [Hydrogenophaga sp. BPS33]|uniref:LysR family transcriptional regulator n=1 Tax=Hydrogenophaga sp. BPS33 TaxID=2651974 RepID=UPI00131FB935|nr:LysR family transcriptional regulator [Hydrogenophaga sp. BPS33]QHE87529.1 LysR family transcriptional regulator [Hydrogenophaga sp. BPS33]
MQVNFKHLRAFVTIANLGSFVEASKALHVTQAALSNAMRELESIVDLRLLDRTTRKVTLSAAGAQYIRYAEKVLLALQEAERCTRELRNHRAGVVRIATSRLVGWSLMAPVFAQFHRLHPDIRVLPVDALIQDIRATVETGQADMAISTFADSVKHDQIETTPLFKSRVHAVCHCEHPLAERRSVTWSDLEREPLIFVGSYPLLRLRLELGKPFEPANIYEVGDMTAALGMVAAGIGLSICPGLVRSATGVHQLRMIECESPSIVRQYNLFTNRMRTALPVADVLKNFLIDYFAKTGGLCVEDPSLGMVA